MKRLFTVLICFLSIALVKAAPVSTGIKAGPVNTATTKNYHDTTFVHAAGTVPLTGYETLIQRRLDSIRKDVPLDYNEYVQNYIDLYIQNREEMGRVVGLSKYYFPIYEKAFRNAGIPAEIEYLSIVESKLDPNAVSRVGATGPWQFMTTTAKLYGLNMDNYVDERRDPVRASYAAAAYIKDAYEEFGDWLLAIASYNCGKSSIESAIAQAGGANDFWSIRQYLPAETRNYVPAYIAVAYVMNYYSKHNILPQACSFSLNIDTVLVDKFVSLRTISSVINVDFSLLSLLNPAYKTQIINGSTANPRRLILPQTTREKYAALYDALNNSGIVGAISRHAVYMADNERAGHSSKYHKGRKLRSSGDDETSGSNKHDFITYKVKRGDTLIMIASKFDGSSVEKIRSMNGLKRVRLQPGMTLKISRG